MTPLIIVFPDIVLRSSGCPIFLPIAEAEPCKKVENTFVAREIVLPINCLTIWPPLGGRINRPSASGRQIAQDCCCDCYINSLLNCCDCEINSSPGFMATSADKPRRPNDRGGEKRKRALVGPAWHPVIIIIIIVVAQISEDGRYLDIKS